MHGTLPAQRAGNEPDLRRIGLHPDFWYPLAVSKELKKGKTLGVSFAGEPIVLVRTESGVVFTLEDRCAHRQMPLSCGVVAGEVVKCCYHAWAFNAEGKCTIPYLPKDAPNRPSGVRPYACREAYGLIFVFTGDIARAETVPFPDLPEVNAPTHKTMFFTREVACHYSFMHENLMDMNHQFLHRRWLKRVKPTLLETRKHDDLVEVKYKFELTEGKAPLATKVMLGGEQDDPNNEKFDIMTVTTRYPYQFLQLRRPEDTENALDLWSVYVPVDREQRRHRTFGFLNIRKPDKFAFLLTAFWPVIRYFTESVFTEDRFAVEMEQKAWDAQGADWNQEILPFVMDLRALLIERGLPVGSHAPHGAIAKAAE
jgi:phenylpropionate dioxygenase-like ring-hydroxylating dioxygenase large terminal subunit